ncbi:hypothetical protein IWX46DRAFT_64524 [Phyllosticta citricarpa]|uniref:Secreted protein n=1 Tax=Phyllosticta citricarpa TaxID=55181 RepID=A0ABR1MFD2_9PEZI
MGSIGFICPLAHSFSFACLGSLPAHPNACAQIVSTCPPPQSIKRAKRVAGDRDMTHTSLQDISSCLALFARLVELRRRRPFTYIISKHRFGHQNFSSRLPLLHRMLRSSSTPCPRLLDDIDRSLFGKCHGLCSQASLFRDLLRNTRAEERTPKQTMWGCGIQPEHLHSSRQYVSLSTFQCVSATPLRPHKSLGRDWLASTWPSSQPSTRLPPNHRQTQTGTRKEG